MKIIRDGEAMTLKVVLRNKEGKTQLGARRSDTEEQPTMIASEDDLGATLAPISTKDKYQLGLEKGVKVLELVDGKLQEVGVEEGFVITRINEHPVADADDVVQDAFALALRDLPKLRSPSSFRAWLFQITVNQARKKGRRRKLARALGVTSAELLEGLE